MLRGVKLFSIIGTCIVMLILSGCVSEASYVSFNLSEPLSDSESIHLRFSDGSTATTADQTGTQVQIDNPYTPASGDPYMGPQIVGAFITDSVNDVSWVPNYSYPGPSNVGINPDSGTVSKPTIPARYVKVDSVSSPDANGYSSVTFAVYGEDSIPVDGRTEIFAKAEGVSFLNTDPIDVPISLGSSNAHTPTPSVADGFSSFTTAGMVTFGIQLHGEEIASIPLQLFSGPTPLLLSGETYVTYNGNGAIEGSVPIDNNVYYPGFTDVVTIQGQGDLNYPGFSFGGWRTTEAASGSVYDEGDFFTIRADTTFYAQWLSRNADASGLTLSSGTVSPAFSSSIDEYTASVPNNVSSLTLMASTADSHATLTINGAAAESGAASGAIDLNVGSNTITVVVTAQDGTTKTYTVIVTRASAPSSDSSGGGVPAGEAVQNETGLNVAIDGETAQTIATVTTSEQNGQTVLTVAVDGAKLAEQLEQAGDKAVVTIPVTLVADKVTAALTGEAFKAMENKNAILEVQTPNGSYRLPASEVLIDKLSEQLGAGTLLERITVQVDIAKSGNAKVELLGHTADNAGFTVVVPPVDFTVTAALGDQSVTVDTFSSFVEREIPIPDGMDAGRITTAIVLNEDGTTRPVPMKIVIRDGKAYAVINSLTNSTYALVSYTVTFDDVANHWAKAGAADSVQAGIVSGRGGSNLAPKDDITRAEVAAIIERLLEKSGLI